MLDKELLEILACPKCKGKAVVKDESGKEEIKQVDLEYDVENQRLICHNCRLKYKIEDDIPIMLIEEAESF
ncbi:MAG: Trm112 family protein [Candidatus Helarchaeota archaeon]|nr:Trm112 family protein [Candidatus Helarchaeota archaeon]